MSIAIWFSALVVSCSAAQAAPHAGDTYANFADLKAHEQEGVTYSIAVTDRSAPVTVYAIHGHNIDSNTERLAKPLAGEEWSLYQFLGESYRLHVTSASFDEPRARELARKSRFCVSIHGHHSDDPRICVGGADTGFRARVLKSLTAAGLPFHIELLCTGLEGTEPANIVNRGQDPGVQLEFSSALRDRIFSDARLLDRTIAVIRRAVEVALPPS